ncbi:TetR/AcrR family transcriptional regulator [Pontibacter sp. SGAir0037]|uniref:TetR/AcrR family transcriptional regulator n=1 Tax=Pontibacter sp. SGAir0037 TaxID=2571030 RepID=UPI0010CCDA2F|nr:TetR/AcrR family transcriptional regulator [Pontibacter sp. SGAir0037]QCR23814.1 TetR/AcrR family transcriptional regulator [Pontibacter sp. SGAir0037]
MEIIETINTRAKIAAEALHLFFQNGIKSISVDDIASHLSMSKKTIYKWYVNKDEIVYEAVDGYIQEIEQECDAIVGNSKNAIDELFIVMGMTRKIFAGIHPAIFHDLQKYHASSWKRWQAHKEGFMLERIKANIRRGIAEGLFREGLDVEVVAKLRAVQIELPFNRLLFPPHQYEIQHVQLVNLEHYMLGLATLKGHKLINEYRHITEKE